MMAEASARRSASSQEGFWGFCDAIRAKMANLALRLETEDLRGEALVRKLAQP